MVKRPRQSDIARRARVSQTTVSLVLNGRSREYGITDRTERRVRQAIAELGYVPDTTAQALRGGRNGLIGVHTFEPLFPTTPEHYYYELMVGIEQQATAAGQDLVLITSTHQRGVRQSIYREGTNRLRIADGAVILGFHQKDEELEDLARQEFPFVFIGHRPGAAELMPYIVPDYVDGVTQVVRLLAAAGHRRVAYLGRRTRNPTQELRFAGFVRASARARIDLIIREPIGPDDLTVPVITGLLEQSVSAVVVDTYGMLERFGRVCAEAGVDIPGQLGAVGLDSLGYGPSRTWTHMQTSRRELGARSVEILLGLLAGELPRAHHELLPCPVEVGTTLLARTEMSLHRQQ